MIQHELAAHRWHTEATAEAAAHRVGSTQVATAEATAEAAAHRGSVTQR